MATSPKDTQPLCDPTILTLKRVLLVETLVLENVISSVKPFLIFTQVDEISGGKTQGERNRKLLDILQLLVSAKQYKAFNAFVLAMAGTQPELFKDICGRAPTVEESDFCMKEIAQVLKTTVEKSKHSTDSELDEQIEFEYEFVELSMINKAAEKQELCSQEGTLPHDYNRHLKTVHDTNRNISAHEVLGNKNTPYKKVSIFGRAGIGKSTTLQFWGKEWALGRWAATFTVLFLLQLRSITSQLIAISTVELLQICGLYPFPDHPDSTPFTSWLKNCTSRILILIDGLDEIPGFAERIKNTPRIHDVLQKAHPIDLCINILRGDLLPGCTVISASRPFAGLSQLPADARAEILGLTSVKVTEYVEHRHPNHVRNIMSVLRKSPILLSVCGITFYCMLITRLLSEGVEILDEDVSTYTRLMTFIVIQFCSRKISDSSFLLEVSSCFSKLAQLAHSGIFELEDNDGLAKLVFDEEDLIKNKISKHDIEHMKQIGLLQVTRTKMARHESWTVEFFHLSAQELLAVAHFLSHPPFPVYKLNQLFHGGQFSLALRFIYGLHFDSKNTQIRKLCSAVSSQIRSHGIEPELSSFIDSILKQKLKVCQLIHEGQWEEKAKEVVHHVAPGGELHIRSTTMSGIDLLAVAFVCQSLSKITFRGVYADDSFVDVLLSSLCAHNWHTLQVLDLFSNSIGATGAAAIANSLCAGANILQVLNLGDNHIGDAGATAIANSLCESAHTLQELFLSHNHIGDAGAAAIAKSLCEGANTLQVLHLYGNSIGDAGAAAIADSLCDGAHTLQLLFLSDNNIGDAGAAAIAKSLCEGAHTLQVLNLGDNRIGDAGAAAIAKSLSEGAHKLQALNLHNNSIGALGATAIANSLCEGAHTLQELNLGGNRIGDAGAPAIVNSLCEGGSRPQQNTSLVESHIEGNNIGIDGLRAFLHSFCSTDHGVQVRRPAWEERRWTRCGCSQFLCKGDSGVDPTQYNTTLRKLHIGIDRYRLEPDMRKALAAVRQHNRHLKID